MRLPLLARTAGALVATLSTMLLAAQPASAATEATTGLHALLPAASPAPLSDANETALGAARFATRRDTIIVVSNMRGESAEARSARSAVLEQTLRMAGREWFGVPYRFGGTTRNGIDCSAFVQRIMRDHLGVELPRNTTAQVTMGTPVERDQLRAGDLVFFNRRGQRHVGIYLSNGEFVHASTSRGVMVSHLSEGYWDGRYWTARRVIPEPTSGARPRPRAQRLAAPADTVRRALW